MANHDIQPSCKFCATGSRTIIIPLGLRNLQEKLEKLFFQEMRDTAQQVAKDVEKVKKIQSDILSAPTVDPKMKSELEDTMAGIKKKANTIRTGLKKMEVVVEEEEKANPNNTQMRMKKTQHMAISKTFIEVMTNYNQVQQDFK